MAKSVADLPEIDAYALDEELEHSIALARKSFPDFYDFVMVDPEDPTGPRPKCVPHLEVVWEFFKAHRRAVGRLPTDTGKTLFTVALALYRLGLDPNLTGFYAGKSEDIASKPQSILRGYLEHPDLSVRVRAVFPDLVLSDDPTASLTDEELTVKRPAGGADPSFRAVGFDSDYQGKKVGLYLADDLLDAENTATEYQRKKVFRRFFSNINSRALPGSSDGYVLNVPWDEHDLTFKLEDAGWPTIAMDIYGYVKVSNTSWTSPLLRPSRLRKGWFRLAKHDPDPDEEVPLFPERWPIEVIEEAKRTETPSEFARSRLCDPKSKEEGRFFRIWLTGGRDPETGIVYPGCLARGAKQAERIDKSRLSRLPTATGMDVSTGESEEDDESALGSIAVRSDAKIVLLRVEGGLWQGPEQAARAIDFADRFGDVTVESNGYQKTLRQWIVLLKPELTERVFALHTDDKKKDSKIFGIEAIFGEFMRGEWIVPADEDGNLEPEVGALVQEMIDYRPGEHVGDRLMAVFIARAKLDPRISALRKMRQPKRTKTVDELKQDLSKLDPAKWRGPKPAPTLRQNSGGF